MISMTRKLDSNLHLFKTNRKVVNSIEAHFTFDPERSSPTRTNSTSTRGRGRHSALPAYCLAGRHSLSHRFSRKP
jgi:hypothetical protein